MWHKKAVCLLFCCAAFCVSYLSAQDTSQGVFLTHGQIQTIKSELSAMTLSLDLLKSSLTKSQAESKELKKLSLGLEVSLSEARLLLEKSEAELIQSRESFVQLGMLLDELKKEYEELNALYMKRQREVTFWRAAAIGSVVVAIGLGIYAAVR